MRLQIIQWAKWSLGIVCAICLSACEDSGYSSSTITNSSNNESETTPTPPVVNDPIPDDAITVSDRNALLAAITNAKGGETIVLNTANYGDLVITNRMMIDPVWITAAAGQIPEFTSVLVSSSKNWRLSGLSVQPRFATGAGGKTAVSLNGEDIIFESSFVSFSNVNVYSWSAQDWIDKTGIGINVGGTRMTVRNNHVKNISFGISGGASHSLIFKNIVENFRGDGLRGLGNYTTFEYNIVKNSYSVDSNHDDGFQSWSRGADGKVGTGEVIGVVLRGNLILHYEDPNQPHLGGLQGIGLFDGTFTDWVIENNVVIVDHWHGISMYGAKNSRIVNNTVKDINNTSPGPSWIMITNHKNGTPPQNCLVRNNIAHSFNSVATGVIQDNNLKITDQYSLFNDADKNDLRLKPGSPAIDMGSSLLAPLTDFAGNPRPQGGATDIGAFEYP